MRRKSLRARAVLLLAILTNAFAGRVYAQSGRSWMNRFIFADSDTNGLAGATVELIGDQKPQFIRCLAASSRSALAAG